MKKRRRIFTCSLQDNAVLLSEIQQDCKKRRRYKEEDKLEYLIRMSPPTLQLNWISLFIITITITTFITTVSSTTTRQTRTNFTLRPNEVGEAPAELISKETSHKLMERSQQHELDRLLLADADEESQTPPSSGADAQIVNLGNENSKGDELSSNSNNKLQIVRLFAPEAIQNNTQNVTIDCMFTFDRKLDQRLTIKWFFNDEVEPIYQWIPELNKRVYSDKYEKFLDKSYQVSEDADFMLQAYKLLHSPENEEISEGSSSQRRLLAGKLAKLAQLGGRQSRQLLDSLRAELNMVEQEFSRFRALRLIRPTEQLSGRFTCSVSSLDGEDLRSTRLLVYEPAKKLTFNVTKLANNQQYNLTCQASHVFPRPSLSLFRYRAGPPDSQSTLSGSHHSHGRSQQVARPRLAATTLRQEPIPNTQTQLTISSAAQHQQPSLDSPELILNNDILEDSSSSSSAGPFNSALTNHYEISSWALIDESSLSSNVVTQFECLLTIEGTQYEQRQSLALQRGWHINSAALTARYTLVSLFSTLASLLCLLLALVSSLLIFKLLKRHARNRVHQVKGDANNVVAVDSNDSTTNRTSERNSNRSTLTTTTTGAADSPVAHQQPQSKQQPVVLVGRSQAAAVSAVAEPEGVYRVPGDSAFNTRFIISSSSSTYKPPKFIASSTNNDNDVATAQPKHYWATLRTGD